MRVTNEVIAMGNGEGGVMVMMEVEKFHSRFSFLNSQFLRET